VGMEGDSDPGSINQTLRSASDLSFFATLRVAARPGEAGACPA
jgi:hypothetical protein